MAVVKTYMNAWRIALTGKEKRTNAITSGTEKRYCSPEEIKVAREFCLLSLLGIVGGGRVVHEGAGYVDNKAREAGIYDGLPYLLREIGSATRNLDKAIVNAANVGGSYLIELGTTAVRALANPWVELGVGAVGTGIVLGSIAAHNKKEEQHYSGFGGGFYFGGGGVAASSGKKETEKKAAKPVPDAVALYEKAKKGGDPFEGLDEKPRAAAESAANSAATKG